MRKVKIPAGDPATPTPATPPLHRNRELIANRAISLETDVVLLDGFDEAIIGTAEIAGILHAVYDREKMVNCLLKHTPDASFEEVEEHLSYNTERAVSYIQTGAPIIVTPLDPWAN